MSVAEAYGGKSFTVNSLEPTALYELVVAPPTPPEAGGEIDRRIAAGEIVSAVTIALKEGFNGGGAVVSYLNNVDEGDNRETYSDSIGICVRALQHGQLKESCVAP